MDLKKLYDHVPTEALATSMNAKIPLTGEFAVFDIQSIFSPDFRYPYHLLAKMRNFAQTISAGLCLDEWNEESLEL